MNEALKTLLNKLTSARFWMAISFSLTLCWMAAKKMIPGEGFVAIVLIVVRDYFNRTDRQKEETQ